MIWRYFHRIGPHSVGGNKRVDSRNIAASIVPFLRLPHPQDIYNFIVGGSLYWGIVEMNNSTNTNNSTNNSDFSVGNLRDTIKKRVANNSASSLYGISKKNWNTILSNEIDLKKNTAKQYRNPILRNYNLRKNNYNKLKYSHKNNGSLLSKIEKKVISLIENRNQYNIRSNKKRSSHTKDLENTVLKQAIDIAVLLNNIDFILTKQSLKLSWKLFRESNKFEKMIEIIDLIKEIYKNNKKQIIQFNVKYAPTTDKSTKPPILYNEVIEDVKQMKDVISLFCSNISELLLETPKLTNNKKPENITNDKLKSNMITKYSMHGIVTKISELCKNIQRGYEKIDRIMHYNTLIR